KLAEPGSTPIFAMLGCGHAPAAVPLPGSYTSAERLVSAVPRRDLGKRQRGEFSVPKPACGGTTESSNRRHEAGQSLIVANDAVAAVAFGGVEAAVGALHEGPRALALAIGCDPSRHRQPADALPGGALDQARGRDTAADVIGNGQGRTELDG